MSSRKTRRLIAHRLVGCDRMPERLACHEWPRLARDDIGAFERSAMVVPHLFFDVHSRLQE
ncbi:MAG TPA: hypothetical protein VH593_00180 [Ktedonobacteraceae bacterium]